MSVTVIAIPGASNANSYQTVAEIDAYFEIKVPVSASALWLDADDDPKAGAAVYATQWMDALISLTGYPTTSTQSLLWPRNSMLDKTGLEFVDSTIIPQEWKNAHAELARELLVSDRTAELSQLAQGLASIRTGPIKLEFKNPSGKGNDPQQPPVIPPYVISLLVPSWIDDINGGKPTSYELVRW